MAEVKVISINENVYAENDKTADLIRETLTAQKTYFINFMSSPGSGKTSLLIKLIPLLKKELTIGEMDVDIESTLDAQKVADATGVDSLQIHNNGLCHIDADMTSRVLTQYDTSNYDLLILENIGNLVCPAEFDTGAHQKFVILSIPEGDDKPLKYPLMFEVADVVIFSKVDTANFFKFDIAKAKERILALNPKVKFFETSAKTGEGLQELADYIIACQKEL